MRAGFGKKEKWISPQREYVKKYREVDTFYIEYVNLKQNIRLTIGRDRFLESRTLDLFFGSIHGHFFDSTLCIVYKNPPQIQFDLDEFV